VVCTVVIAGEMQCGQKFHRIGHLESTHTNPRSWEYFVTNSLCQRSNVSFDKSRKKGNVTENAPKPMSGKLVQKTYAIGTLHAPVICALGRGVFPGGNQDRKGKEPQPKSLYPLSAGSQHLNMSSHDARCGGLRN